ncbi:hypothetical protein HLB44_07845 [Aquincola sp. S2]|uniref:DUF1254 domain-containing protein n=1 Tax=Pseudaquabacterium terrae TaxID=2732868 RepID=A0ABX2EE66_9BURK|nr:hypothetical protein [Aquabacterium terrae]NRF66892.1 hypothetical protein [Aquabacterium terrae]
MSQVVQRWLVALLVVLLAASVGFNLLLYPKARQHTRLVAVSWGDGPGAPALYGAYVWVDGDAPQMRALLTVFIDRPSLWASYEHETRVLGPVDSPEQAVQQWGRLRWDGEGLHVGIPPRAVTIPASELQRHR